ncbi:hypothetical protein CRYUN_Cryun07bG0069300 [Craigia yunnanensis]
MVSKIDNAILDFTFKVDDGTGWVECTKWIHEHVDSIEENAISIGMYVRVYGQLKSIQSRRTLHTISFRPVIDFNEIAYHFIECIYTYMYNTKLRGSMTIQPSAHHEPPTSAIPLTCKPIFIDHPSVSSSLPLPEQPPDSPILPCKVLVVELDHSFLLRLNLFHHDRYLWSPNGT